MARRRAKEDTTRHLVWFFNDAPAAVSGLRSSWGALIEMANGTATKSIPGSTVPSFSRLSAAARESDIASRLERLTPDERVALGLFYTRVPPWRMAADARERLGEHHVLAPLSLQAQAAFLKSLDRADGEKLEKLVARGYIDWLGAAGREQEPKHEPGAFLREVQAEARLLLRGAQAAWESVAPKPDAEGRVRHGARRGEAQSLPIVVRKQEREAQIEPFAPWEDVGVAAE